MTPTRARRLVVAALAAGALVAVAKRVVDGEMPSPRILVGAFIAAVILVALADAAPSLAAAIAVTSLIGGAIAAGPDSAAALSQYLTEQN